VIDPRVEDRTATAGAAAPATLGSRWRGAPRLPLLIVLVALLVTIFADVLVPHPPTKIHMLETRKPPAFLPGGDGRFLLGTDLLGRDILSRIVKGTQVSLAVAGATILLVGIFGTTMGLIAGYQGGAIDAFIMRTVDAALAFPAILIALVLVVTVGPGFWVVVSVLVLLQWARYARLVRGEVLSWKEREFVALARVAGCSTLRIVRRHILPNVINSVVVLSTLQVGWIIAVEATLSFLGAGVPPPTPTWGGMVADGRNYLGSAWWISLFPGTAILIVVLSFNLLGDWLRDALDPKLRQL
jgi:peptide/nickel transport system permease protein